MKSANVFESFRYALRGIWYCLRNERNYQIHGIAALLVFLCAWYYEVDRYQWYILLLTVMSVLVLEMINTAIELMIDLISPEFHPIAKIIKDISAGAVLIASIVAVVIGVFIFFY